MILQVAIDLLYQLYVVSAIAIQPEDHRGIGLSCTADSQLDPVSNGLIFGLTGAPDIASFNRMLHQYITVSVHHAHGAGHSDLKCLVVGAVFLSLFRHQAHVGHTAHGGRIECTVGLAKIDHLLVDRGISTLGHYSLAVFGLAVRAPHLSTIADHRRHGRVNDDITGYMQIGNPLDGVHHGQFRSSLVTRVDVLHDLLPF